MRPITATDLMNPEVLTVRDDLAIDDLAAFLLDNEISGAPVVDQDGRLVGVVSLADVAAVTAESSEAPSALTGGDFFSQGFRGARVDDLEELEVDVDEELTVADIMNPEIYSVGEDATASEVASLMLTSHIHRVLVLQDESVVGIISTSDLLGLLVEVDGN